ncbi:flagellin [Parasphingorhabdus sp.]|uniref:flagellin n=1 Tax=Parasphingorhabdus sp. TaxID=2709688 RepID=UPI003BB0F3FF
MQSVNRNRPSNAVILQNDLAQKIADRQEQISTRRRINRASEDPAAWSQISNIAKVQANMGAWLKNIDRGVSIAGQADGAITGINDQLIRAKELLVQASSQTISQADLVTIAQEIESIGDTISDLLAQENAFGQPLFSIGPPLEIPIDDNAVVIAAPSRTDFNALAPLITTMAATIRTGNASQRSALLAPLDAQISTTANIQGKHGIESDRLEQGAARLKDRQIDVSEYRKTLEETDLTVAITEVQKMLISLEAAQAAYARIEQTSLFDQLR